jgi:hypothetical protein
MIDPRSAPSIDESSLAVGKAVASRRARHRADPAQARLTASAIIERVTGITMPPRDGRDGWWLVGRVLDDIEDVEFSVWYIPETRRIGLSRRERPAVIAPSPPIGMPFYYDGLRRKWIDSLTGEVVAGPDGDAGTSGRDHESRLPAAT